MADVEPGTPGAHGSEPAGQPYKVFQTQAEFDAHAAGLRAAVERKVKTLSNDERAKLEAVEAELEAAKVRDLEREKNYQDAAALREKRAAEQIAKAEAKAAKLATVLHKQVQDQIHALAAAHGAYDPEDIVVRVLPRVTVDEDGQVHVSDAPGGAVQDGVTLEATISALIASKPHLARPTGSGRGAGTSGGASLHGAAQGSPAVREAQAAVEAAKAKSAANPRDPEAAAALITAMVGLKQAQAS